MVKKDVFNHRIKYEKWKQDVMVNGVDDVNSKNSTVIVQYVFDMEQGRNIARGTKKGPRSYIRLNNIRQRLSFLVRLFEARDMKDVCKLTSGDVGELFNDMRSGKLRRRDGGIYKSAGDYVKVFKAFWHWFMKVQRGKGVNVADITEDLDSSSSENSFVYFTLENLKEMFPHFSTDEQVRMLLMFDTIIRSPTELLSLKRTDVSLDFRELTIPEEVSKTYGRTIKLLLCKDELRSYLRNSENDHNDDLFEFTPRVFNTKLKKVATQLFGDRMTKGGMRFTPILVPPA